MAEQKAAGKRKSTMKKVWYYLKNYRFLLIVSVVMAAVTVACMFRFLLEMRLTISLKRDR